MSKNSKELLQEVHTMLAEYFLEELKAAKEDGIPMMSSTLSVIVTFLKNNEITADVRSNEDLSALREKIRAQTKTQEERGAKLVEIAEETAKIMDFNMEVH